MWAWQRVFSVSGLSGVALPTVPLTRAALIGIGRLGINPPPFEFGGPEPSAISTRDQPRFRGTRSAPARPAGAETGAALRNARTLAAEARGSLNSFRPTRGRSSADRNWVARATIHHGALRNIVESGISMSVTANDGTTFSAMWGPS